MKFSTEDNETLSNIILSLQTRHSPNFNGVLNMETYDNNNALLFRAFGPVYGGQSSPTQFVVF